MASDQSRDRGSEGELGLFLRARRTRTSPGQVGLTVGMSLCRTQEAVSSADDAEPVPFAR